MPYQAYRKGVVDCSTPVDTSSIKGKSVVITGGAGGMGEQAVYAFVKAGAFVTFGDLSDEAGKKIEADLAPNVKFCHCDVTSWDDQYAMFRAAKEISPSKSIDVVIANAGITGPDPIFYGEEPDEEPKKPTLKVLDVNVNGAIYTLKLARYYFLRNEEGPGRDRCFIIMSSLAGYGDVPGGAVYMASKFAARALMRCVRRTTVVDGIRSNALAPWYVATGLMSSAVLDHVRTKGIQFADAADAAGAMLKIACEPSINGRCFTIVPRTEAPFGYYDMDVDDYSDGSKADIQEYTMINTSHRIQVNPHDQ
ncbi:uncharacterized protein Z519_12287 [Cladophialophora bantiana CBS 173.52]|uniref:Uncharacterized protein n=1 Tax=Cladophialophora bantiana (strain ATCC 10958 / CBS 173.52 / CDC B-1940 / NIH 8579) TaxID=1442370 RepID=A0A0D2EAM0_CLAB1|nr:uncharacterized protein Z519_12287 [Cladophialophora bantiana CBS 173.52]KIW87176.1 hypothetical protein Z519_12287 [Cladophialophora bantiana CBS 173.52]